MEMYIYKMQYADREEFTDEEYNKLLALGVITETDYGTTEITTEILASTVQELDDGELLQILNDRIGTDTVEAMKNNEIDFGLVVWG